MNTFRCLAAAAALLAGVAGLAPAGLAMGTSSDTSQSATPSDPDLGAGMAAIERKDWIEAVMLLTKASNKDDKNADIHNYLGYAFRNAGDYDSAFRHYARALAIDPEHRGAHEYAGEAYLMTGNLPKAEEHLAALDRLCLFGCPEYTELKAKVATYRKQKTS